MKDFGGARDGRGGWTPRLGVAAPRSVFTLMTSLAFLLSLGGPVGPQAFCGVGDEQPTLRPIDEQGEPVSGWFTQAAKIGYDDFFAFSDHFGASLGDDLYDPLYDISPTAARDGTVDMDDYFVFADHFGTVVVNADEIVFVLEQLPDQYRLCD